MKDKHAVYLGRVVEKKHFRTFIYGPNGNKKLVNSWDDFERHMSTGIWFDKDKISENVSLHSKKTDEEVADISNVNSYSEIKSKQSKARGRKPKNIEDGTTETISLNEFLEEIIPTGLI